MEQLNFINTFVNHLSNYLKKNKSFKNFLDDFTDATVAWIRPLFLKEDGTISKSMEEMEKQPEDSLNKTDIQTILGKFIRDNPDKLDSLKSLLEKLNDEENENYPIKQTHYGTGDNIGRDKNINK